MGGKSPIEIEEAAIVLAAQAQTFWLVRGDEHIDQLMLADGKFPTPVICMNCETMDEVLDLAGTEEAGHLWQINPQIVDRLDKQGRLKNFSD